MHRYHLEREQIIDRSRRETFAFFSDARNLEALTPPFLKFRILTPSPIHMSEGTMIDYRIVLHGVPIKWRTLIETWAPEEKFVDTQLSGPYALWRHTHTFADTGDGRTIMKDHVEYAIPFGPLGRIVHGLFVHASIQQIFDFRAEMITTLLSGAENDAGSKDRRPVNGGEWNEPGNFAR